MADLSITASQVLMGTIDAGADFYVGIAAAAVTAGQSCYLTPSNTLDLADANVSTTTAAVKGIALHAALAGQPLKLQTAGDMTLGAGAAPVVGQVYIQSATPGGIAPNADAIAGWYKSVLGVGKTGNKLGIHLFNSGALVP